MPIEIKVGTGALTISQDRTFMVTDEHGEIDGTKEQGVFGGDTRYVSFYKLYINDERWDLVTSSPVSYYAARLHFASPALTTEDGDIPAHSIGLAMTRTVGGGIHEDLDLINYANLTVRFQLQIGLLSDQPRLPSTADLPAGEQQLAARLRQWQGGLRDHSPARRDVADVRALCACRRSSGP
jgi:hypothetical protein